MSFDEESNLLIEWGKEEGQPDFAEFVDFIRDRKKAKEPIVVEVDGVKTEFVLQNVVYIYRKPFPDFDVFIYYFEDEKKKKYGMFFWRYTYMNRFKKLDDGKFCVTDEDGKETIVRRKD